MPDHGGGQSNPQRARGAGDPSSGGQPDNLAHRLSVLQSDKPQVGWSIKGSVGQMLSIRLGEFSLGGQPDILLIGS